MAAHKESHQKNGVPQALANPLKSPTKIQNIMGLK